MKKIISHVYIEISICYLQLIGNNDLFTLTGTPNREMNFEDKSRNFHAHSQKLAETAKLVAAAGANSNKRTVEGIHAAAQLVISSIINFK